MSKIPRARKWEHGIVTGQFSLSPAVHAFERARWRAPAQDYDPGSKVRLLKAPRFTLTEAMADAAVRGGLATRARFENDPEFRARMKEASRRGGQATKLSARRRNVEPV
jgi:hypothetical protein